MTYFTRYTCRTLVKMLNLHYHELIGRTEKHERKKYLMVNDYMAENVFDKVKIILELKHLTIIKY